MMNWEESYSIGIPQIDMQHQHLFFLLNKFYNNCLSNASYADLVILYKELVNYATYHFSEEERWMKENQFPKLEKHKKEHKNFSKRVVGLDNDFHAGKNHIMFETASFVQGWVQTHILKSDAEFGRFVAANSKSRYSQASPGQSHQPIIITGLN